MTWKETSFSEITKGDKIRYKPTKKYLEGTVNFIIECGGKISIFATFSDKDIVMVACQIPDWPIQKFYKNKLQKGKTD